VCTFPGRLGRDKREREQHGGLFRETFESTNPDAEATYTDGVLGDESWLATVVYPYLPDWKLLYFQHNGVANDIACPRVPGYSPTEEQMIALAQTVIDNLP
jgi:hypothetical protein